MPSRISQQKLIEQLKKKLALSEKRETALKAKNDELEAKNDELEAKNDELEAKNNELETTNSALENKNSALETKNAELVAKLDISDEMQEQHWALIFACIDEIKRRTGFVLVEDEKAVYELIARGLSALKQVPNLKDLTALYARKILETKRKNPLREKPETKKLKERIAKSSRQIASREAKISRIDEQLAEIAQNTETQDKALEQAARDILERTSCSELRQQAKVNQNTHGREVVPQLRDPDHQIAPHALPGSFVCPKCKRTDSWIQMAEMTAFMRSLSSSLNSTLASMVRNTKGGYPIMGCQCGHVHLHLGEEDIPVTPTRSISQGLAIDLAFTMVNGIPLERMYKMFGGGSLQIGSSTFQSNLEAFYYEAGASLLVEAIQAQAQTQTAVIADGSPFRILQQEGCSQKLALLTADGQITKIDRGDEYMKQKILQAKGQELPKQPYLEVITSVPGAERPFVLYKRMLSRSGKAISSVFGSFSNVTKLITDAYAGYDALDQIESHQCCLVHFLREVFVAVPADSYAQMARSKSGVEQIKDKYRLMTPDMRLLLSAKALRLVFDNERLLAKLPKTDRAQWLEQVRKSRQQTARPLMDYVDLFMSSLTEQAAIQALGKWRCRNKDEAWSKAVVYYLNQRDKLRAFLDDPELVVDSNAAERAIRPFTVLRAASSFRQSPEATDVLLGYFTLFETAAAAGIKNPCKWLREFGRAYFNHQADAVLTRRRHEGLDLNKEFSLPRKPEPGFNMGEWLPWVYAADPKRNI